MFTPRLFKIKMHTRRVLIFKRSLPVFAFLLASLMLAWPTLIATKEQFSLAVKSQEKMVGSDVDMERVRFFSQDNKRQPLTVTAPKVLETDPARQIVTLYEPVATYKMESGVILTSKTPYGFAFQKEQYLYFEDEVVTTTDTGYQALSSRVICDHQEGTLDSESPVVITGPSGKLKAEGFLIYNKGDNIDFRGKTDTTVFSVEGNIRIRSQNGLLIDQIPQTITALQNVIITQNDKVITADKVVLTYNTTSQNMDNRIAKIEAFGHVEVQSPTQKMTGDKGVYDPRSTMVEMTGNVFLYQGRNYLEGDKATLDMTTGESTLVPKASKTQDKTENSGRVRGQLLPADLNEEK